MKNQTQNTEVKLGEQILFDRPNSLVVCNVTEIREKAIKVDYAIEPIFAGNNIIVFNYSCFIPKSVLINDENKGLTVKKWFANNFKGGYHIKKYYIEGNEKKYI